MTWVLFFLLLTASFNSISAFGSCGDYDVRQKICCGGTLSPKKGRNSCCGQRPYDYKVNICCGGKLFSKGGREKLNACCRNMAYDNRIEICCRGKLSMKTLFTKCCGRVPFNTNTEICCFNYEVALKGSKYPCDGDDHSILR